MCFCIQLFLGLINILNLRIDIDIDIDIIDSLMHQKSAKLDIIYQQRWKSCHVANFVPDFFHTI